MHEFAEGLFNRAFWLHEGAALRDMLLALLRVGVIYAVGHYVIDRSAVRVAQAAVYGPRRFGLTPHAGGEARLRTLISLIRSTGLYALFFVCAILLLRALGFDAVSVVTSASVAGIAVGFGAQKLFRDVISGFFILLENQYAIGDTVTINTTVTGRVEEMAMRIVKLRDDQGRLYIFANGDISQVCNQSRGAIVSFVEVGVAPGTDLARARELLQAACHALGEQEGNPLGLAREPSVLGVSGGDAARTALRLSVEVADPGRRDAAALALRDAAYTALRDGEITPL